MVYMHKLQLHQVSVPPYVASAGSQIVWCGRMQTRKAKIRRARLSKGDGGGEKNGREPPCLSPAPARFSHFFLLNDFSPLSQSLEQATPYATCTFPIMHFISPPKFCISIVFNFSWDGCNTQEKWKTMLMQNFGRQKWCIMRDVKVAYRVV